MKRAFLAVLLLSALPAGAWADLIAQWNFNSLPPDGSTTTGTNIPSAGFGSASLIEGVTDAFSNGCTNDPAPSADNSGWATMHYPSQGTSNRTTGVQFNASTLGYSNIVVRWDQRVSSTASKYYRLEFSSDGANFTDYPLGIAMMAAPATSSYFESQTNSLAAFPSVNNNPNFAIRIVSEWQSTATGSGTDTYATTYGTNAYSGSSGTVRFDMVTISGTVIPGANTTPYISAISNQTVRVGQSTGPLAFTVLDAEDPAAALTLVGTSSDSSVVPVGNIVFGGSSANRTVNVTAGGQSGSAIVTVWARDTGGRSNSSPFSVAVLPANTAPVISTISPTNTLVNTATAALGFTVGDAETPAGSLSVSATSANVGLVPNANLILGGSGSNRTVTVTPAVSQSGVAPITVTVSDGTNTVKTVFGLMVNPAPPVIFYEPFAYTDGSLITNSGFLWDTRSGTPGQCQVTNGQLVVLGTAGEDVVGTLAGAPYNKNNNTILYAAFKAVFLTLPKVNSDYFAHFGTGSSLRARIFAGTTNAAAGAFRLGVANGTGTALELPSDLHTNTSYTLVTRYNIDTATATLWLNPNSETDTGTTASDVQTSAAISHYGFRQDTGVGALILVDDLKVGLTFAAVTANPNTGLTPIPLNLERRGQQAVLSWTNPAFSLQAAPFVGASFTNVPGAASPYTNVMGGAGKVFRLKGN